LEISPEIGPKSHVIHLAREGYTPALLANNMTQKKFSKCINNIIQSLKLFIQAVTINEATLPRLC
jgi:hypothetical protein